MNSTSAGKNVASGGDAGSNTLTDADAPGPTAFTARSRTVYDVPLVSPVIVTGLVVSAGDSEVHVAPEFNEYW